MALALALASLFAVPALPNTAAAAETRLTQHCEDLAKEFNGLTPAHVNPTKMKQAKEQAGHGEKMCKSDPKNGIKALDLAFKDVGATPK